MNVIWRTLLTIMRARVLVRRHGRIAATSVGRIRVRTLPTDIDLLGHMNNGRYASLFDLGRFDLLVRTGLWDLLNDRGWYAVVASETITFRKSLELWQRFTIESRLLAYDEKGDLVVDVTILDPVVAVACLVDLVEEGALALATDASAPADSGAVDLLAGVTADPWPSAAGPAVSLAKTIPS